MPGVTARSAKKNVSKATQSALNKNSMRVQAALTEDLEGYCTFGKISKKYGGGRFIVLNSDLREYECNIRASIGKAIRPSVDDVVLLSIRDYETRASSADAVYDIIASFDKKQVSDLVKNNKVPIWMKLTVDDVKKKVEEKRDPSEEDDLFDYSDDSSEDDSKPLSNVVSKKDKKNHRASLAAGGGAADDSDIDIDRI
jgi:translation initiation factor IF-1